MKKKKKTTSDMWIELWISKRERKKDSHSFGQLVMELESLNPGISRKKILEAFYKEKIGTLLKITTIGGILLLFCIYKLILQGDLKDGKYIERKPTGDGERVVVLDAVIGDEKIENVEITIEEQKRTKEETKELLNLVKKELPTAILANNESLDNVRTSLNLMTEWDNSEVSIYWTSSNYDILREDGFIETGVISGEGEEVILTAFLSCDEIQEEKRIPIKVYPNDQIQGEDTKEKLIALLETQNENSKTEKYFELPDNWNQTQLIWKEKKIKTIIIVVLLFLGTLTAVSWGRNQEIHKKYESRNRQLLLEYTEFVCKIQLLISSGMSIRSTFLTLGTDYQKRKRKGGKTKYVYEELLVMIRKLENGMEEKEAYDSFAQRCNLVSYKKLIALILQNKKKGADGLKESLLAEVKNAFEQRKLEARRLGEEAGTKLLFPMMMMMVVVMMIIVIPAYLSFGGI